MKTYIPHKNLYMSAHRCFTHNGPKVEATQMDEQILAIQWNVFGNEKG